jgi:hypothetical protein
LSRPQGRLGAGPPIDASKRTEADAMKIDLEARYLCEAGYERAVWRPPAVSEHQPVRERRIKGLMIALAACCVVGMLVALNNNFGPHETTARMERILTQLERMHSIRPEIADAITRIISQPGYDCERIACDANLKARNMAVRFRLETSLAAKALVGEREVASTMRPAGAPSEGSSE